MYWWNFHRVVWILLVHVVFCSFFPCHFLWYDWNVAFDIPSLLHHIFARLKLPCSALKHLSILIELSLLYSIFLLPVYLRTNKLFLFVSFSAIHLYTMEFKSTDQDELCMAQITSLLQSFSNSIYFTSIYYEYNFIRQMSWNFIVVKFSNFIMKITIICTFLWNQERPHSPDLCCWLCFGFVVCHSIL